jgi:hypothetical protein
MAALTVHEPEREASLLPTDKGRALVYQIERSEAEEMMKTYLIATVVVAVLTAVNQAKEHAGIQRRT